MVYVGVERGSCRDNVYTTSSCCTVKVAAVINNKYSMKLQLGNRMFRIRDYELGNSSLGSSNLLVVMFSSDTHTSIQYIFYHPHIWDDVGIFE